MSKRECICVGLIIGIACPFLGFVAFWWTTAWLHLQGFPVPEGVIKAAALAGFGLGCLLDIVFLRRWVEEFYTMDLRWMIVVYVGCFVVAFASFMGVPIGTLALGIAAGIYMGRREHHRQADETRVSTAFHKVATFAASATTLAALPIGILALQSEQAVLRWLENTLGMNPNRLQGGGGFILIGFLCLLLFLMQYGSTRLAGRLAFRTGTGLHQHQTAP